MLNSNKIPRSKKFPPKTVKKKRGHFNSKIFPAKMLLKRRGGTSFGIEKYTRGRGGTLGQHRVEGKPVTFAGKNLITSGKRVISAGKNLERF